MKLNDSQETIIRDSYLMSRSVAGVARETGHSRNTIARVLASQGASVAPQSDREAIDYDLLAAKVADHLSGRGTFPGAVNEGPPSGPSLGGGGFAEYRQPRQPGIYDPPRLYGRIAVLGDLHYPYPDQPAIDAALDHIADWRPELIVINGDLYDGYMISRFGKSPDQLNRHLQREFDLAKPFVKAIDGTGADVYFILGNHEARIDSLVADNPGLAKLRALEWHNMAELPKRWTILPQFSRLRLGSLDIHHGDLKQGPGGRYVAARILEDLKRSSLHNHFHRFQTYSEPDGDGVLRACFSSAHLCDPVEAAKYCRLNRWATGFSTVDMCTQTGLFEVRSHLIHGGKFRSGGKTYG